MSLIKAERPEIEVQSDTQGVLGSPEILPVILKRIRECDVFVGDVTLTGISSDGKKAYPNPNVCVEFGYSAAFTENFEKVLMVMNDAYGSLEKLPFDFRNRRKPVGYTTPERKQFIGTLKSILREYYSKYQREHRDVLELAWDVDRRYGATDFGLKFGLKNNSDSAEKNIAIKFYRSQSFNEKKLLALETYGTNWWNFQQEADHRLLRYHDERLIYPNSFEWACKYDNGVVHSTRPNQIKFVPISFDYEILSARGVQKGSCTITQADFVSKL